VVAAVTPQVLVTSQVVGLSSNMICHVITMVEDQLYANKPNFDLDDILLLIC
jgi:hypothetical protein